MLERRPTHSNWLARGCTAALLLALACDSPIATTDAAELPARTVTNSELPPEPSEDRPAEVRSSEPAAAPMQVEVTAGASLREELVPLATLPSDADGRSALFDLLREVSTPLCEYEYGLRDSRPALDDFLLRPGKYLRAARGTKLMMIAGCWNFVRMNDRRPDRDFELVRAMYPAAAYDCTAVGVMQPYLMNQTLGCRSLHVLDFDWQVHAVHDQLLARAGAGEFAGELDVALAGIRLAWIAHRKPRAEHPASLDALCYQVMSSECADALRTLGEDLLAGRIEDVRLDIAGLHEASFSSSTPDALRVVYLSNAVENIYTSWPEFQHFLAQLTASLPEGGQAILIHHAGGHEAFGLYELHRVDGEPRITTRCADVYPATASNRTSDTYETWLDRVSVTGTPAPTCARELSRVSVSNR